MPGYTDNAKDGMLGQVRGRITHLSLHTASPGDSGANEVTGGGYARAAVGGNRGGVSRISNSGRLA
jgi:hypothetical protein